MSEGQGAILKPHTRPSWFCAGVIVCAATKVAVMPRRMDLRSIVRAVDCCL